MKDQFLLTPDITFLNHGSFGACPKVVFENYRYWQLEFEKEPVYFIQKRLNDLLRHSRQMLGDFVGCEANDLFFTPNPSTAINTVMRSMKLEPGDEILSTNLEYGAMDRMWNFYCRKNGTRYVQQPIELPLTSKEHFLEQFWKGYSERTKVVFISHITSSTALILPVQEIVEKARSLGLITIVDGAHVPGHIDLNITALDCDYYTGAVHKWLLSPKGCSFLYARKEVQDGLDPLIVSWGYDSDFPGESRFIDYHEYNGTRDFSPYLTVPELFEFREANNWVEQTAASKALIREWYPKFCELLNTQPICPVTEEFLGQMCSIPVNTPDEFKLKDTLYDRFGIQIPVTKHGDKNWIRLSLQPYNTIDDIQTFYQALQQLKEEGELLIT
ncbi:MAG: aminotransferase class V-fold PLP-dependent enzyme [Flavobacteriales bacterium]|nr:aminotransferase class V-fold PLP-dependent enzyme [Flavobacteriales bacterium]